jgi:PAS domain S-box-containing protein
VTAAPGPARAPRLILRFALYSAIALMLAGGGIFWFIRHQEQARAEEEVVSRASRVAARVARDLRPSDFGRPLSSDRLEALDRLFVDELSGGLVRVKLWGRDGKLVYSNEHALIGRDESEPHELENALNGQSGSEIAFLDEEAAGETRLKVLEAFAPVRLPGERKPMGALELYHDYGPIADDVNSTVTPIGVALGLAWILLYGALFPILRQVTKALEQRNRSLAQQADAYRQALDERVQAERRLSEAERNYRNLVEQLPLVTYVDELNEACSSIYISPQVEEMLGYPVTVWLSDPDFFPKILHPDDREWVLAEQKKALETGRSISSEYRFVARDGRVVWVRDQNTIARNAQGRPLHAQGFLIDITKRKEAEEQLERRHGELTALHDTALRLIDEQDSDKLLELIVRRAGKLVGTSDCYAYLLEPESGEQVLRLGTGIFRETVGYRVRRGEGLVGRVWESGKPFALEDYHSWPHRRPDLDGIPFHAIVGVPLFSRREVVGVLGLAHPEAGKTFAEGEIALLSRFAHLASLALESARLYTAARESEEKFRTLVSNVPGAIFRCAFDSDWTMEFLSDAIVDIAGYPASDFIQNQARTYASIVHPDDAQMLEETVGDGAPYSVEYRVLHADGSVRWVLERGQGVEDGAGNAWLDGAIFDITEQKAAEEAVQESEGKFRAFVETTEEWVWAIDERGVTTYSNPAVERILGYRPEELIGGDSLEHMCAEDREHVERLLPDFVARKSGWSGLVVRWRHKDGSVRHLESTATPVVDASGVLRGWRGTDRDVTQRVLAEEERERLLAEAQKARLNLTAQNERLLELDRLKDEFIALVSHELRTPLTSIRGYVELLRDGEAGELNEEQLQFLAVVERNSHRLLHLVGDLLFLAQVEAGKLALDLGAVDLGSVASDSVETARPAADEKGVTLTLATGPVPLLAADRPRLAQLLDNLVSNAIKFTPAGGRVDVRVRAQSGDAVVEVRDSGIGIPAGEQEHLFQRFFRTSNATAQAIQGTGLGLAISKAIVEAHGGRITVASQENEGTTFRVTFPLQQPKTVGLDAAEAAI